MSQFQVFQAQSLQVPKRRRTTPLEDGNSQPPTNEPDDPEMVQVMDGLQECDITHDQDHDMSQDLPMPSSTLTTPRTSPTMYDSDHFHDSHQELQSKQAHGTGSTSAHTPQC